jgi:hypothetical protein
MTTYGKTFSKGDVEAELQTELTEDQWQALKSELNEAFEYYFDRDVEGWTAALSDDAFVAEEPVNADDYKVTEKEYDQGGLVFTKGDVDAKAGFKLEERDFGLLVEFFDRAFNKYFQEECENLWGDIDSIVTEYLDSK